MKNLKHISNIRIMSSGFERLTTFCKNAQAKSLVRFDLPMFQKMLASEFFFQINKSSVYFQKLLNKK